MQFIGIGVVVSWVVPGLHWPACSWSNGYLFWKPTLKSDISFANILAWLWFIKVLFMLSGSLSPGIKLCEFSLNK